MRERKEDVPLLTEHFFIKRGAKEKISLITPSVLEKMKNYDWPGNVRELENFVERMIALSDIEGWENELFAYLSPGETVQNVKEEAKENYPTYEEFIGRKEKEIFIWAIKKAGGNVSKAASLLGLPRSTFRSKLEKLNLERRFE